MKLTFVTNYMNHHQFPMSECLFGMLGDSYHVITTQEMEAERVAMGWEDKERPYVCSLLKDEAQALRVLEESDVILYGGAEREDLLERFYKSGKLVLRYTERIYKTGQWKAVSPRGLRAKNKAYRINDDGRTCLLCAGGYVASDFALLSAYKNRRYRFGYFPKTYTYTKEELFSSKPEDCLRLIWVGRMIDWKQPERALWLAKRLQESKVKFRLDYYGSGPLEEPLRQATADDGLTEEVTFHGYTKPEDIRKAMLSSHILLVTSNREEGWGAVLNEAMNSACIPVADSMIGAAPYLIRQNVNGYAYPSHKPKQALSFLESIAGDYKRLKEMGLRAYETIRDTWNEEVAARRLVVFCESLLKDEPAPAYEDGPLSKAPVIKPCRKHLAETTMGQSGRFAREGFSAPQNVYICHTFYHVYIALLHEMKRESINRGNCHFYLSDMSQNLTEILERLNESPYVGGAEILHEVRHTDLPKAEKYHKMRSNILLNLLQRIIFTKVYAKAQNFPLSALRGREVFVFCDSDPVGYVLNAAHIPYHAMEDGFNCLKVFDAAHADNEGHFALKKWMSKHNLIFIQNGYSKYALDMEVNDDSTLLHDGPVYRVVKKSDLEAGLSENQKKEIVRIFIADAEQIAVQLKSFQKGQKVGMFLSENWPGDAPDIRRQVCLDIKERYFRDYALVIKPHPADNVDYKELCGDAIVLRGRFPIEVLNFFDGLHVDLAVSIVTSAMDSLRFVDEKLNLGPAFWDAYEDPEKHAFMIKNKGDTTCSKS